jgi:ABC-type sugar transport system ATPase subunit
MTTVIMQIFNITKAATAAAELFETIDRTSTIDPMSTSGLQPDDCVGNIELQDVVFAYPSRPDSQVLNGLSLSIPAKKTTALVGASGSGKSTIVALLERWYDQKAGTITLDGRNIRDLNLRYLRTKIRLVQQEPVLFSGTVFDNVAYGLLGTKHENAIAEKKLQLVQDACKDAFAHEFVEQLPEQYFTQIGERARMLSGGKLTSQLMTNMIQLLIRGLQVRSKESPSQGVSSPTLRFFSWMRRRVPWTLGLRPSYSKLWTTSAPIEPQSLLLTSFPQSKKPTTLLLCRRVLSLSKVLTTNCSLAGVPTQNSFGRRTWSEHLESMQAKRVNFIMKTWLKKMISTSAGWHSSAR